MLHNHPEQDTLDLERLKSRCKPNGLLLHKTIKTLMHLKITLTWPWKKRMLQNILLLSLIHTWTAIFIWVTLSVCQKLNSKLDIKDKEEEEQSYLKVSIAQVCQFKLQLTDWELRLLMEKLDPNNQRLKKLRLQSLKRKRKKQFQREEKKEKLQVVKKKRHQLLKEFHQLNTKSYCKLVFQSPISQLSKKPNIGSNSSHQKEKKIWFLSVVVLIGEDLSLQLPQTHSMILSSDGNSRLLKI